MKVQDSQAASSTATYILFIVGIVLFRVLKGLFQKKQPPKPQYKPSIPVAPKEEVKIELVIPGPIKEEAKKPSSMMDYYSQEKAPSTVHPARKRIRSSSLKQMVISKEILNNPFIEDFFKK